MSYSSFMRSFNRSNNHCLADFVKELWSWTWFWQKRFCWTAGPCSAVCSSIKPHKLVPVIVPRLRRKRHKLHSGTFQGFPHSDLVTKSETPPLQRKNKKETANKKLHCCCSKRKASTEEEKKQEYELENDGESGWRCKCSLSLCALWMIVRLCSPRFKGELEVVGLLIAITQKLRVQKDH